MNNLINDIEIVDKIGQATDMATDIKNLSLTIYADCFTRVYENKHEQALFLSHYYEMNKSLFRILNSLIFDLSKSLTALDKSIIKQCDDIQKKNKVSKKKRRKQH